MSLFRPVVPKLSTTPPSVDGAIVKLPILVHSGQLLAPNGPAPYIGNHHVTSCGIITAPHSGHTVPYRRVTIFVKVPRTSGTRKWGPCSPTGSETFLLVYWFLIVLLMNSLLPLVFTSWNSRNRSHFHNPHWLLCQCKQTSVSSPPVSSLPSSGLGPTLSVSLIFYFTNKKTQNERVHPE